MDHEEIKPAAGKWWAESVTVWGVIVTAAATVLPHVASAIGFTVSEELARQAGEQLVATAQGLCGLAGVLMTIWGRARASAPLTRRDVTIKV